MSRRFVRWGLCVALAVALVVRMVVVWKLKWDLPNGDEAVGGLMARHIAEGLALPIFFYGQGYFGALESYLQAPLFLIFGFQPNLLLIVPTCFSILIVAMEYVLARALFSREVALASACLIAIAPLPFLEGTLVSAGGFALACLLELAAIWLFARLYFLESRSLRDFVGFCVISGLTCWVWQLYVPLFALLLMMLLLVRRRLHFEPRTSWFGLTAFLAASSPWWIYSAWHGGGLRQCVTRFLGVDLKGDPLTIVRLAIRNRIWSRNAYLDSWLTAVGGRNWVLLVLIAVGIAAVVGAWWPKRRKMAISPGIWLLLLAAVAFVAGHRALRYLHLMPLLMIPCALAGWKRIAGRSWVLPVIAAALINAWSIFQLTTRDRPATIWQQTVAVLQTEHLKWGYSNFWDGYPLVYLTNERVIVSPILANNGGYRVARYPAYDRAVAQAPEAFLLLPDDSPDRNHAEALMAEDQVSIHQLKLNGATLYWPLPLQSKVRHWLTEVWQTDAELKEYRSTFGAAWMKEW